MALASNQQKEITHTERGLVIAGTRITLYQFMDYIDKEYPAALIREHFPQITDDQFEAAMSYIKANRTQVEAEYQIIVQEDEQNRQYWEAQNRERFAQIATLPPPLGKETAWSKLQVQKAKFASP